jgi:hypothetical protein
MESNEMDFSPPNVNLSCRSNFQTKISMLDLKLARTIGFSAAKTASLFLSLGVPAVSRLTCACWHHGITGI